MEYTQYPDKKLVKKIFYDKIINYQIKFTEKPFILRESMNKYCDILKNNLQLYEKTNISLHELYEFIKNKDRKFWEDLHHPEGYRDFVISIKSLIADNMLEEIKSSPWNGQNPPLKKKYKVIKSIKEDKEITKEILTLVHPIDMKYYLHHQEEYREDREYILIINEFFKKIPVEMISVNERSYELFNDEKFLKNSSEKRTKGEKILKNLCLTCENLYCYTTQEPFFCFINKNHKDEKNILIIENKDTFWSFKNLIFDMESTLDIYMIIYGEGNKITSSFQFVTHYNLTEKDKYIYYGDLDAEGINIFLSLREKFPAYNIEPFIEGYIYLINTAEKSNLPKIKHNQKIKEENIITFYNYFETSCQEKIKEIIRNNLYVPQEAFSFASLKNIYGK